MYMFKVDIALRQTRLTFGARLVCFHDKTSEKKVHLNNPPSHTQCHPEEEING